MKHTVIHPDGTKEVKPIKLSLEQAQAFRVAEVKAHARDCIEEIEGQGGWRIMRAQEQDAIAPRDGVSRYMELITSKEAIRQASNTAEAAVMALTEVQAVADFAIADYFTAET